MDRNRNLKINRKFVVVIGTISRTLSDVHFYDYIEYNRRQILT